MSDRDGGEVAADSEVGVWIGGREGGGREVAADSEVGEWMSDRDGGGKGARVSYTRVLLYG